MPWRFRAPPKQRQICSLVILIVSWAYLQAHQRRAHSLAVSLGSLLYCVRDICCRTLLSGDQAVLLNFTLFKVSFKYVTPPVSLILSTRMDSQSDPPLHSICNIYHMQGLVQIYVACTTTQMHNSLRCPSLLHPLRLFCRLFWLTQILILRNKNALTLVGVAAQPYLAIL